MDEAGSECVGECEVGDSLAKGRGREGRKEETNTHERGHNLPLRRLNGSLCASVSAKQIRHKRHFLPWFSLCVCV